MSQISKGWLLIGMLAMYFAIHRMQHTGIGPEVIRFHGKAFIFIPVLMLSIDVVLTLLHSKIAFKLRHIASALLYSIAVFEILVPAMQGIPYPDWADISGYCTGAAAVVIFSGRSQPLPVLSFRKK